jgi:hypothetical protein
LKPGDAIDLVEECRKKGIAIGAIDGFYLFGNGIQPSMDNSVDYSQFAYRHYSDGRVEIVPIDSGVEDTWVAARSFLEARLSTALYFEMMIDE